VGFEAARRGLLRVGRDPRPYMRTAYDLFSGEAKEVRTSGDDRCRELLQEAGKRSSVVL
jgi:hypothetical protein